MKKCFNCGKRLWFNKYAMRLYIRNVIGTNKIKPNSNLYFCEDCFGKITKTRFDAPSILNDIPVQEVYIDIHKMIVDCNQIEII